MMTGIGALLASAVSPVKTAAYLMMALSDSAPAIGETTWLLEMRVMRTDMMPVMPRTVMARNKVRRMGTGASQRTPPSSCASSVVACMPVDMSPVTMGPKLTRRESGAALMVPMPGGGVVVAREGVEDVAAEGGEVVAEASSETAATLGALDLAC